MFELLSIVCLWVFLTFPVGLLILRFLRRRWMPWWLLVPSVMAVGWIVVNVGVYFRYEHLSDILRTTPDPSRELIREATADGAPRLFALLLGWAYGLVYLIPWLLLYGFCHLIRCAVAEPAAPKLTQEARKRQHSDAIASQPTVKDSN